MTRNSLLRSILTLLFLLNLNLLSAQSLHVDEGKSRLEMVNGVAELRLEVMNRSRENLKAHIELTFLVASGAVAKSVERDENLKPGRNVVQVRVPQLTAGVKLNYGESLLWFRLRYRLSLMSGEETSGIASLSRLMPDTFRLQMGLLRNPVLGEPWVIHVLAQDPAGVKPVDGVQLKAQLEISPHRDGPDRVQTFSGRTDAMGAFTFRVPIPKELEPSEITVTVEGRRGNEVRTVDGSVSINSDEQILVNTDKPIYQPGQSLKVRALAFGDSGKALRSHRLQFRVEDDDGATVYQTEVTTSRFGEAHTDWTIPENARLGSYSIYVEDGDDDRVSAVASVEVRRYDLPNFSVSVKPDRTFYLPGQNAVLEIQTDYLFGQHVSNAKIRVIPDDQEDSAAKTVAEGEADVQGLFSAAIDLREVLGKLETYGQQFNDANFKAYATDPSTGRTESRKFALRLSREAIHIYVATSHALTSGFPAGIFIATQYPDGRPAECEVQVSAVSSEGAVQENSTRTIRTNRYGIAYLQESGWKSVSSPDISGNRLALVVTAKDGVGNTGEKGEQFAVEDSATWITTDKITYSSGDPIQVHIQSTHASGVVVIDLVRDGRLLKSKIMELRDGIADLTAQSDDSYQGTVGVTVHFGSAPYAGSENTTHSVYFPTARRLQLELLPGQNSYAPGSDATLSFRVRSPQKYSSEALLGISIVDRAVEERSRMDFSSSSSTLESVEDFETLTLSELLKSDRSVAMPEDLRLATEYLLKPYNYPYGFRRFSNSDETSPKYVFENLISQSMRPMKLALDGRFEADRTYVTDETGLREILSAAGWKPDDFLDPWGNTFQFSFEFQMADACLNARSAGPDKVMGTGDDFDVLRWRWPYFQGRGELLVKAVSKYQSTTRAVVRDLASLRKALLQSGEDLDQWLDPWGRAYQYGFVFGGSSYSITAISPGPDGVFDTKEKNSRDDAQVHSASFEFVGLPRRLVQEAVNQFYAAQGIYPQTESQLQLALNAAGVSDADLADPWGHRFYAVVGQVFEYRDSFIRNFIGDIFTYAEFLELERNTLRVAPVTQQIQMITFRSAGPDGVEGNPDDFDAFRLSRLVAQQSALEPAPRTTADSPLLNQKEGAITGLVQDSTAALIPGVTVRLLRDGVETLQTVTMDDGRYTFARLAPGYYDVRFQLTGFRQLTVRDVPVQNRATELNAVLALNRAGEVNVTVSSASVGEVVTRSALISAEVSSAKASSLKAAERATPFSSMPVQTSTPRLRQYFPETLVWHPSLEVDRKGNAQLQFKLADNITQWEIRATASTMDGRFANASANIVSWQPFFVEHDPPKILTVGDAIALPVVMRSYLDREQSLNVSMKPETWFEIAGTPQRTSRIASGATARETFRFTARTSIKDGKQRVTAAGSEVSDAIEKTVTVRPDGREVVQSQSRILQGSTVIDVNVPANSLRDSVHAELKIYPDLMSQLSDAMEGIMRRPYGCAEQQISSAYPGLLLLQHQKAFGGVSNSVAAQAKKNLFEAYVNLLGLQVDGGGFSYWGNGTADIAVTAYAVEFLQNASRFIPVDERVLNRATTWLVAQQRPDGSWSRMDASSQFSRFDALTLTGYVARVLSDPDISKLMSGSTTGTKTPAGDVLEDALGFLRANAEQWGEPASLASVALTALNTGDRETAIRALGMIERSAHAEAGATFWDLQTNTLFFGWGLPGRVESTALSVRALAAGREAGIHGEKTSALIEQGMLFLLGNKDRYGVWHSTQSTIRVLETMERLAASASPKSDSNRRIDIWIDGAKLATSFNEAAFKAGSVLNLDISKYLKAGATRIELRGGGSAGATVQLVESHYVPWEGDSVSSEPALRLNVGFDRTSGKADAEITATVNAARVGFRGYGMMLAEIGLPPGVDVDRASLDKALADSGTALFRYDVLPDRVIAYLWPKAGGSQFQFKFRPRFGMDAQAPPSILYDYYNPEAQTILLPVRFNLE